MDAKEKVRAIQLARFQIEHRLSPERLHAHAKKLHGRPELPFEDWEHFEAELAAQDVRLLHPHHPEWSPKWPPVNQGGPYFLYARGAPISKGPGLAVVGSRTCSDYPIRITREVVTRWARLHPDGFVATGGGMGVDAAALRAAAEIGFPSVVVLASDVVRPTPRVHAGLLEKVAEEGTLLSENASGLPCFPSMFPYRNRLIPWLVEQTVVVCAALRSGSFHTLRHASGTGAPVWAVVGPIDDPGFAGNLQGIRRGLAKPLFSLDELGRISHDSVQRVTATPMGQMEVSVWNCLRGGALHLDDVTEILGLTASSVMRIMLSLELKGLISREAGNRYRRVPHIGNFTSRRVKMSSGDGS